MKILIAGLLLGALAYIIFSVAGPDHEYTVANVTGNYARHGKGLLEILELHGDGTFVQSIASTNGLTWGLTNTWSLEGRSVHFDRFYLTYDSEHDEDIIPPEMSYTSKGACIWRGILFNESYVYLR